MPNNMMKESRAVLAARWKSCSAMAGKMLRSRPTMAPTNALTSTSSENCAAFARSPSLTSEPRPDITSVVIAGLPSSRFGTELDREAGQFPFGQAVGKASGAPACGAQLRRGLTGVNAVRPATVSDVWLRFRQLMQPLLEILDGNRERTGNVAGGVLSSWPRIEHNHLACARASQELIHLNRLRLSP